MQETDSWVRKIPWRRNRLPTPIFLPGKNPHGQKSLSGYSPWGWKSWTQLKRLNTLEPFILATWKFSIWKTVWDISLQCDISIIDHIEKLRHPQMVLWRRQWQPTPVLLLGKSHGRRSLVGYSPWGLEESGTTERLHFHFSLSCIAEGNGNPLQCSRLEKPRDRGAWWATIYGVMQSWTRLKRLSSSSSSKWF